MTDELTATVTVDVAGEEIEVPRPPFRRFRPLLPLMSELDAEEGVEAKPEVIIDVAEGIAQVLFGDDADSYLDRLYTPEQFLGFLSSAMAALQLGEAVASTGT